MISVGIDVSKGESTVCVMKPGGEVLKPPFKMLHSIEISFIFAISSNPMMKKLASFWKILDTTTYLWYRCLLKKVSLFVLSMLCE